MSLFASTQGADLASRALSYATSDYARGDGLHIVSTSLDSDELQKAIPDQIEAVHRETHRFSTYLTREVKWGYVEEREIPFTQGSARIPRSRVPLIDKIGRFDRVAEVVSIQGYQLPQSASLRYRIGGAMPRVSKDGLESFFVPGSGGLTPISIPSDWTVLSSIFEDAGYRCLPSDKGRIAMGAIGTNWRP